MLQYNSLASETVLGVDNAKLGICYVWIVRMPLKRAQWSFSPKNMAF